MAYNKDIHMRDEVNLTLNSQYRTDLEQVEARYTESCKRQQQKFSEDLKRRDDEQKEREADYLKSLEEVEKKWASVVQDIQEKNRQLLQKQS